MTDDYLQRFGGVARLVGRAGLDRLRQSHVAIVGLGGVGSWAVEALARSGIGQLTLVDLDEICVSNVNRQLPAVEDAIGKFKAEVLAERVRAIHPDIRVHALVDFFTAASADRILSRGFDAVVDAIDVLENKCRLIAACRARNLPLVVCGGAGGRTDPTRIREADLTAATHDRLLAEVRRRLRRDFGFPSDQNPLGIPSIYSLETMVVPRKDGTVCSKPTAVAAGEIGPRRLNCDSGYGSACFVTGALGFAAAASVVRRLVAG